MSSSRPTVVLVHGAFTDASVWHKVIEKLQDQRRKVLAPSIPLTGLAADTDALRAVLETVKGPLVLVAHSYAGAVITGAGAGLTNTKALVYVAAVQPDAGEPVGALISKFPGSQLGPGALAPVPGPDGPLLTVAPESFREVLGEDLPAQLADVLAVAQRPVSPGALEEPLQNDPAWRRVPSWAVVTTGDNTLPPAALRFMAGRAGSIVTELDSSHLVPLSRPDAIAQVIAEATDSIT